MSRSQTGMSLIELMIAVGILGVLSAIALPLYTDYVSAARIGVMKTNMEQIALFEESYRSSEGTYVDCVHVPGNKAASTCDDILGWELRSGDDSTDYNVVATARTFTITADNHQDDSITESYP